MKTTKQIKWCLVPILIVLVVVPLIVGLNIIPIEDSVARQIEGEEMLVDLFSKGKSVVLMITLPLMWLFWGGGYDKKNTLTNYKSSHEHTLYFVASGVFVVMTLLATFLSSYQKIAWFGYPNRNEGALVWCAYIGIMIYSMYNIKETSNVKMIFYGLGLLAVIQLGFGIFQYQGEDPIVHNAVLQKLFIPDHLAQYRHTLSSRYQVGTMHGTLENSNFMGSFTAMIVPFFLICTIYFKSWKSKILSGLLTLIALVLLVGSASSAGMVGVAASAVVVVILMSRQLIKYWKAMLITGVVVSIGLVGINTITEDALVKEVKRIVKEVGQLGGNTNESTPQNNTLKETYKNIKTKEQTISIETTKGTLNVTLQDKGMTFTDEKGEKVPFETTPTGGYKIQDTRFEDVEVNLMMKVIESTDAEGIKSERQQYYIQIGSGIRPLFNFMLTPEGLKPYDTYTDQLVDSLVPERIGFEGKEQLGSGRGYIWSVSLGMMKDTLFLGHGPDTYILTFPQYDRIGKWKMTNTNIIVDKPHNMYMQIGINHGGIALISFLVIVVAFGLSSIKKLLFKPEYDEKQMYLLAILAAIVGYLVAGFFNDSIVSVAPVFWVLLGTGIALNTMIKNQKQEEEKEA